MSISDQQLSDYWRHGYVVVENLLEPGLLGAARAAFERLYPNWNQYLSQRKLPAHERMAVADINGPFRDRALNAVAIHPDIVEFAKRVIGTDDITMRHTQLNAKYYGEADYEQYHHLDFGMHTLTFPRDDSTYHILAVVVYYSDVTEHLGPTCMLSQELTRRQFETPFDGHTGMGRSQLGGSNLRWQLARDKYPELYEQERPVIVPAGSALFFNIRTFHRGSRFTGEGARYAHFLNYYAAEHAWAGLEGWGRYGALDAMQAFLIEATPEARQLVSFHAVADPFWNEETLRGVAARYPGMDMTPYRRAFAERCGERRGELTG